MLRKTGVDHDDQAEGLTPRGKIRGSSNKGKHRSKKKNIECHHFHKKGQSESCHKWKAKEMDNKSFNESVNVAHRMDQILMLIMHFILLTIVLVPRTKRF